MKGGKTMIKIEYHKVAYVEVEKEIFDELQAIGFWNNGDQGIVATVDAIKDFKDNPQQLSKFITELLVLFEETNFDGDIIFMEE